MEVSIQAPQSSKLTAQLLYNSGPELYDFLYKTEKNTALDFIEFEYLSTKGFCSHKNLSIISKNKNVIATGCFYTKTRYPILAAGTVLNIFQYFGLYSGLSILIKLKHLSSIMATPRKQEVYLSNFSVDPNYRGQGIGTKILNTQRKELEENNITALKLDVADNNPRAKQLYESLGFVAEKYKEFSQPNNNVPNAFEMKLAL